MWQLETKLFASFYIWLAYILEVSYRTVETSVSEKLRVDQSIGGVSLSDVLCGESSVDQSELEK